MKIPIAIAAALLAACATTPGPQEAWGPLMTDERFAGVQQGMSRDDVLRVFGPPRRTMAYPLSGNDSWEYLGYDTWTYMVEYSVTFDPGGRVLTKTTHRVNAGGDRAGP
jgi:outer membrane protein assembly factor BamE (lipoprotein component of BamABCDE complex)